MSVRSCLTVGLGHHGLAGSQATGARLMCSTIGYRCQLLSSGQNATSVSLSCSFQSPFFCVFFRDTYIPLRVQDTRKYKVTVKSTRYLGVCTRYIERTVGGRGGDLVEVNLLSVFRGKLEFIRLYEE